MRIKKRNHQKLQPIQKSSHGMDKAYPMEFTTFVRKPFTVEAVEITAENIAEVAKYVGDLKDEEDGTQYILVDRRLVPNIARVYAGFFMTKMGKNVRCYSKKIFTDQFEESNDKRADTDAQE